MPPVAIAPIASSRCPGVPSLRTRNTSIGAFRAVATCRATGTPPRGSASTSTADWFAYDERCDASSRPANRRSRKRWPFIRLLLDQLLVLELQLIQPVVNAAVRQQFLVRSRLAQLTLVEDDDAIHVLDRG